MQPKGRQGADDADANDYVTQQGAGGIAGARGHVSARAQHQFDQGWQFAGRCYSDADQKNDHDQCLQRDLRNYRFATGTAKSCWCRTKISLAVP